MAKVNSLVRGEIYLVNFDPTLGSEIKKKRPALIIQNDVANEHSPVTIVAAITSTYDDTLYPTEVLIPANEGGLKQDSVVLLNQIRSIDRQRLAKKLGKVEEATMKKVDSAIKISLGLIEI
ncbi:MAG: type II toxin-antitoxin system PemK/MazF family toxin [Acidobacteria bacterium]|jgi:mRNA interferase MazF|nr:type II toxin-antitoxin system PemK/MazF family toxin [Acidobacteriota bacterium]